MPRGNKKASGSCTAGAGERDARQARLAHAGTFVNLIQRSRGGFTRAVGTERELDEPAELHRERTRPRRALLFGLDEARLLALELGEALREVREGLGWVGATAQTSAQQRRDRRQQRDEALVEVAHAAVEVDDQRGLGPRPSQRAPHVA